MKITNRQFSVLKTLMAQLHLLRQLGREVYWTLQNTICIMFMCKINVDRSERKKIMKKKQDYEAMEP